MDNNIGARERVTQNRLIGLFKHVLKYTYLGNWEYRVGNNNIEVDQLWAYLTSKRYTNGSRKYTDKEISAAITKLKQAAANLGGGLYNANKEVYDLLRYGVMFGQEALHQCHCPREHSNVALHDALHILACRKHTLAFLGFHIGIYHRRLLYAGIYRKALVYLFVLGMVHDILYLFAVYCKYSRIFSIYDIGEI